MNNVMVDLETMGQTATAAIVSIGAVRFSERGIGEQFYVPVSLSDCQQAGLTIEASTVMWWLDQSSEARQALVRPRREPLNLSSALLEFARFIEDADTKVWGNGADFDNAILINAYRICGLRLPWKFWNNRCYRTLKNLRPNIAKPKRTGTHHDALQDAIFQANHTIRLLWED